MTDDCRDPLLEGRPIWVTAIYVGLVLAIIGAVILESVSYSTRRGTESRALTNMKLVGLAVNLYLVDNNDCYPPTMVSAAAVQPLLAKYAENQDIFRSKNPDGGEIFGNPVLAGHSIGDLQDSRTTMMYDSKPWGDNALIGFADGSASNKRPFRDLSPSLATNPFRH